MRKGGRKKDRPIPCDYLAGEKSERAKILFDALRPHIRSLCEGVQDESGGLDGPAPSSILDVTCGTSPLSAYILNEFPGVLYTGFDMNEKAVEKCRSRLPGHTWICSLSNRFVIEMHYDIVIHIGVSSPRYDVSEIHSRLVENPLGRPALVLIEWGDNRDGTCDTRETYDKIREIYMGEGYGVLDGGEFDIGDAPYPVRRYEILRY